MTSPRNDDAARIFGDNLKRCRERATVSQEDLAFMAGLHRTEISHLERGLREPKLGTIIRLQGALEATFDELLQDLVWQPGSIRLGKFRLTPGS